MASITNRVNEANKFLENGHKHMKTSLLKWTPDYDNAAHQFTQAAMAFKGAGLNQKAIEANDLAIKCYQSSQGSSFQAAKCMEQAALSYKELGDFKMVANYYMRAIDTYRTSGQPDTAISVMDRAAKALADNTPTLAADIYVQASETCAIEDRYRQAAEYCHKAAFLFVRVKNYQRAAHMLREEYNCYSNAGDTRHNSTITICLVLVHLANKDIVGASSVLKTHEADTETYQIAQNLIKGYDKRDSALLNSTVKHSIFINLDNEYAKIARDLQNMFGPVKTDSAQTSSGDGDSNIPEVAEDDLLL